MNPCFRGAVGRSLLLLTIILISGCAVPSVREEVKSSRPNILFILTDDLRYDALGAYGNTTVRTPNLDALAAQGQRLNRFFVAAPVCHPSRASLLTGLYPHQDGIQKGFLKHRIKKGIPTVASRLREAGYTTGFIGKSHPAGDPYEWGFQVTPAHTETSTGWNRNVREEGRVFRVASPLSIKGKKKIVRGNTTHFLVDKGITFIQQHADDRWFLWFATNSPHSPYFYDEDHPYDLPDDYAPPGYTNGNLTKYYDPDSKLFRLYNRLLQGVWERYFSHISTMDQQLGRLFETLETTGQAENTLIVFTSDNGIMHGSHGIPAKPIWYEEATRVPAIVRWPGHVEPGTETDALVSSVDVIHTFLDAAEIQKKHPSEGRSFLPILRDRSPSIRSYVYSESHRPKEQGGGYWYMIRGKRYKYVQFRDRDEQYLYDLRVDPHEQNNLIGNPEHQHIRKALQTKLETWLSETRSKP